MEKTTDEKISEIYNDKAGFASLANTIKDVRRYYPEVHTSAIKSWYKRNVDIPVRSSGYNSFVPSEPLQEFQVDLFNLKSKIEGDQYTMGIACVDIFTKYAIVVAIPNKQSETLLDGLKQIFKLMGKPKVLMTDMEGGLQATLVNNYLKKEGITYIVNRNHCPFIERFIRTFKNMVYRRLQKRPDEKWYNLIFEILLTYNRKLKHSSTGFTPVDAMKHENQERVKTNLHLHAKHNKAYEEIKVGDKVRVYRKRSRVGEKEDIPLWSKMTYEVVKVDNNPHAGKLYYLSGLPADKPVLRSQILLVKS